MRPSMPTACGHHRDFGAALQIGQRQRHFIAWNRTTKETGSELIQAMALKRAKLPWQKARHGPASPIPLFLFMKLAGPIFWHHRCIYIEESS